MTNREAIASEIEPYSLSDEAYETAFVKSVAHFGIIADIESNYDADMIMPVAYAGMICLAKLLTLNSENIGGVSQSYNPSKLIAVIKSLAASAGLSASLVLSEESVDYGVKSVQCW